MDKPFITVWYITSKEPEYLKLSVGLMASFDWASKIVILHTDQRNPNNRDNYIYQFQHDKVVQHWYDFGKGFSKPIEKGGFDEVGARNMAIDLAGEKMPKGGWLLQCDSDEFYDYKFGAEIYKADSEGKDGINVNCNHLINSKEIGYLPSSPDDPHIRAFKVGLGVQYKQNPNTKFLDNYPNKSVHCVLNNKLKSLKNVKGLYHFHARNLIGKKKLAEKDYNPKLIRKKIDYKLPKTYLDKWTSENICG